MEIRERRPRRNESAELFKGSEIIPRAGSSTLAVCLEPYVEPLSFISS